MLIKSTYHPPLSLEISASHLKSTSLQRDAFVIPLTRVLYEPSLSSILFETLVYQCGIIGSSEVTLIGYTIISIIVGAYIYLLF